MSSSTAGEPAKRKMHRTITGSRVDLSELENMIQSASLRDLTDLETSSVSSTRSGGGRSNIIQVVPGKRNVKAAMRAALAEAQGFNDADDLDHDIGTDDEDGSDTSEASTPKQVNLKHNHATSHATEPLEGAGVARRSYHESSAPPEGAGGYQTGEFVPPQVVDLQPTAAPKRESLGPGMHRSVTGSSLRLAELNTLVEKAGDTECSTPTRSGRTPRSQSGRDSLGSRSSSIIQIQPGVKDIRSSLASALSEGQDGGISQQADETSVGISERQSIGLSERQSFGGSSQAGGGQAFGTYRPRSIRRLMSEKSMPMDTVYSGALPDDIPSDPLEGTGVVSGRKYVEPKHGPQFNLSPRDFPRVVNGVPMMASGEIDEEKRSSVPPSPMRKVGSVHRTISGSQMNLNELEAILEKATVPKSERQSLEGRSSTGGSQTTFRSVSGSNKRGASKDSQVFGEEVKDEPKTTFGVKAKSFNSNDLQKLILRASVPKSEPESPRSIASSIHA